MRRGLLALVAVGAFVLLAGTVAGASWTQAGHDATRTGAVPDSGPSSPDVAFEIDLPGYYSDDIIGYSPTGPMIHDGAAYVPIRSMTYDDEAVEELNWTLDGIARIDLETAEVEPLVELEDRRVAAAATDGERVFLSSFTWPYYSSEGVKRTPAQEKLEAYRLSDGSLTWSWDAPALFGSRNHTAGCTQPAVADGTVYHACNQRPDAEFYANDELPLPRRDARQAYIAALDAETGEQNWVWTTFNQTPPEMESLVLGVSVIGDHLFATQFLRPNGGMAPCFTNQPVPCDDQPRGHAFDAEVRLLAIDLESGTLEWDYRVDITTVQAEAGGQSVGSPDPQGLSITAQPTGTPTEVYMRVPADQAPTSREGNQGPQVDRIMALNPGDGTLRWVETVGGEDVEQRWGHGALTLQGESIYTTSSQNVYRIDTDPRNQRWSTILDPEREEHFWAGDPVLGQDRFYTTTNWVDGNGSSLYAVNKTTGEVSWRYRMPYDERVAEFKPWGHNHYASLGDGVLAVLGGDGTFRVLGETQASIGTPNTTTSSSYPDQGETVRVDLSGTEPGAFGEPTRYKADWGDGTATGWQSDPVVTHAYNASGGQTARFWVGNDANQTASTTETFHVGEDPPPDPNFAQEAAQTALADGNVDITFGVIGIVMALTGGAVGVARRRRKRSRLQQELETLEEGFEETRGNPGECEAFLETRKGRAHSLLMDGTLTEEQYGVIEGRVSELKRDLRTGVLDERFQFLPHGMVQSLKKMLGDGELSTWERSTLEDLLEEDETLNEAQRERVRGLLERWSEDAGGGGLG